MRVISRTDAVEVRYTMAMFNRLIVTGMRVLAGSAVADAQVVSVETERIRARQQIAIMEGVLANAIVNGTQNVIVEIRKVVPDYRPRTSQARVSGVRLDGYGDGSHVEVPARPRPPWGAHRVP